MGHHRADLKRRHLVSMQQHRHGRNGHIGHNLLTVRERIAGVAVVPGPFLIPRFKINTKGFLRQPVKAEPQAVLILVAGDQLQTVPHRNILLFSSNSSSLDRPPRKSYTQNSFNQRIL
ncbi:hypothetical protein D3C75_875690 [compost metagenome]